MNFVVRNIGINFSIKSEMKLSNGLFSIESIPYPNDFFFHCRYSDFIDLASVLCKYIKPRDEVLVIGCGNSTLSSDLYDTGITNIQNIDLSEKVIKQMKRQNEKRREKMQWLPMDARQVCHANQSLLFFSKTSSFNIIDDIR